MFALVVSALSVVLGGLFLGWIAMQLIGEQRAKYAISALATIAILTQLEFGTSEASMGSIGLLLGLALLLVVLLRPKRRKPAPEAS